MAETPTLAALLRHGPVAALLVGLLLAAALPPLHFVPGILAPAVPFLLLRHEPRTARALLAAFLFAFAFALGGLYWVAVAFWTDPTRWGALAVPAVLLLCLTYAATLLPAFLLVRATRRLSPALHAFLFAVGWIAVEAWRASSWLRFPWNPVASVWAFSDTALGSIAWIGVAGLGLVTVAAAAFAGLALLPAGGRRSVHGAAALALLASAVLPGVATVAGVAATDGTGVRVRLVQANIAQHHKWDPALMAAWFGRHLELTARPAPDGPPALVVWPESAVPYDVEESEEVRRAIADVLPEGAFLAVGADRFRRYEDRYELTNSLYLLASDGRIVDRYDKVDLVPFGEFLPFRRILRRLGLRALAAGSIDFQPGPGRRTLVADDLPAMSPLICYEAAYAGRATDGSGRARMLVNVTNDGWFGRSSGPYQHFAMARMRAIETGLPLLRAANTGISAIVDGAGRVRASLALGETGVVDGVVPPALSPPPIARAPWLPVLVATVLGILCFLVDFRRRRPEEGARRHTAPPATVARDRTR